MADDGLDSYYAEKLWALVPAVHRNEDARTTPPGVLRGFIELLAHQAARVRRSQDRLWDDQFIELCDDWAVPYVGDLLATRTVSALDARARRADVAKTIYYRRRSGTLALLEELIADITGFEGIVVEELRRMVRTPHLLEPALQGGRFTGTLPGGLPDLHSPRIPEIIGGPFDELSWTLDTRVHHGGKAGRIDIPKLGFHLYRLCSYRVRGVSPAPLGNDGRNFLFDPSGRDVPLFQPASRGTNGSNPFESWRRAREWELPAPLRCHVLGTDEAKKALVPASLAVGEIGPGPQDDMALVPGEQIAAANLARWTVATGKHLAIDPERGRLRFVDAGPADPSRVRVSYRYGFAGPLGAGPYDRAVQVRGDVADADRRSSGGPLSGPRALPPDRPSQLDDSATYESVDAIGPVTRCWVQADNGARPFVRLGAAGWVLTGAGPDATLVLDGLWLAGGGDVVLQGEFDQVWLRSCTLDPGGQASDGTHIRPVSLVVQARIRELRIYSCITGPIATKDPGALERVAVEDSIVQALDAPGVQALDLDTGSVRARRTTVFGDAHAHVLDASEVLVTGKLEVDDTQHGCFRFGAAAEKSVLPHPYETVSLPASAHQLFVSREFGNPGYAQLSEVAGDAIARGAENGSEIGAFSSLLTPIKLDSLWAKVGEFMPFGLIPVFLLET